MINPILRKIGRQKLNILTHFCHERYDSNLAKTGHNFFSIPGEHVRTWDEKKGKIPENYSFVPESIFQYTDFDIVLCGNPVHLQRLGFIARAKNLPLVNIFHTNPGAGWNPEYFDQMFGQYTNIFITESNSLRWSNKIGHVVRHYCDTNTFRPGKKEAYCLSVVNDWMTRKYEYGWDLYNSIIQGIPRRIVGDTPGLSQPAADLEEMAQEFGTAGIFVNTSLSSPISMSLLEAASAGCAIVSTSCDAIPDFFEHEKNALLFSPHHPEDGRRYIESLLRDEDLRNQLGNNARQMAKEYSLERFVRGWNDILERL